MIFTIRDDDTNFFTKPEDLLEAYGDIWNRIPITLFIVPYMMGHWKSWVYERHFNYSNLDFNNYNLDKKIYPIGNNTELVTFLKKKAIDGTVELAMHGINHRNLDAKIPYFKSNRGENAEFFTNRDLTIQLRDSKRYLEELFELDIKVFSPPQNLLSHKGYQAVVNNNLNLIYNRRPRNFFENVQDIGVGQASTLFYKALIQKLKTMEVSDINQGIKVNNIMELKHTPLQPGTNINYLLNEVTKSIQKNNLGFVLSTHYFALQKCFDKTGSMKDNLQKVLDLISQNNDIRFMTISQMIETLNA